MKGQNKADNFKNKEIKYLSFYLQQELQKKEIKNKEHKAHEDCLNMLNSEKNLHSSTLVEINPFLLPPILGFA